MAANWTPWEGICWTVNGAVWTCCYCWICWGWWTFSFMVCSIILIIRWIKWYKVWMSEAEKIRFYWSIFATVHSSVWEMWLISDFKLGSTTYFTLVILSSFSSKPSLHLFRSFTTFEHPIPLLWFYCIFVSASIDSLLFQSLAIVIVQINQTNYDDYTSLDTFKHNLCVLRFTLSGFGPTDDWNAWRKSQNHLFMIEPLLPKKKKDYQKINAQFNSKGKSLYSQSNYYQFLKIFQNSYQMIISVLNNSI